MTGRRMRTAVIGLCLELVCGVLENRAAAQGAAFSAPDVRQSAATEDEDMPGTGNLNFVLPTLGGRQFWGDVHFRSGWRIQHNVFTDHYRLLDDHDVRRAWGTEAECRRALEGFVESVPIPAMSGRAVILVHGIIRSSKSFSTLRAELEKTGVTVVGFDYPSTRVDLKTSTSYLTKVIASLEGIDAIDFVVHSMGGILVRSYLKETAENPDPRLRRMVMMGVPNQGAKLANIVQNWGAFKLIFGPAGQQLVEGNGGPIAELPIPQFEFGIIAGARGTPDGWNPLIPGDDDGTVSLSSTHLDGAKEEMTVPVLHSFIMNDPGAIRATINFLATGSFRPPLK